MTSRQENASVVDLLNASLGYLSSLMLAADACQVNFRWHQFNNSHSVPFLDFDIIFGALPSSVIETKIKQPDSDPNGIQFKPIGPHMLRSLLSTMEEYTLPPGTIAEVLDRKKLLTGKLSERANTFLTNLQQAKSNTADIVQHYDPDYPISTLLLEDLNDLSRHIDDLTLMQTVVKRSTPIEQFFTPSSVKTDAGVFKTVFDHLTTIRPKYSRSNFHDAINASSVYNIYLNPPRSISRPTPILITDTTPVQSVDTLLLKRGQGARVEPYLFQNRMYLMLAFGLLKRCERRYRAAFDEAELFGNQVRELERLYATLIDSCDRQMRRGARPSEIGPDDLSKHDLSLLLFKKKVFDEEWRDMLYPDVRASELDRGEYLRLLLSPQVKSLLDSTDSDAIKEGAAQLEQNLRTQRHPEYQLWDALLNHSDVPPVQVNSPASGLFKITVKRNTGELLRRERSDTEARDIDWKILSEKHDIRVLLEPNYISTGVVLAIDTWRNDDGDDHFLGVTWLQSADLEILCDTAVRLLRQLSRYDPIVDIRLYRHQDRIIDRIYLSSLKTTLSSHASSADIHYVEICSESATYFADLRPLGETERQAGLVFGVELWMQLLRSDLSAMISSTAELPFEATYVQEVLNDIGHIMGLGSNAGYLEAAR
jgi:hypothetical protein